jgi:hypothetical protein
VLPLCAILHKDGIAQVVENLLVDPRLDGALAEEKRLVKV